MREVVLICVLAAAVGGCGGQYVLTVPDQLAPAGGECRWSCGCNDTSLPAWRWPARRRPYGCALARGRCERLSRTSSVTPGALLPAPPMPGRYLLTVGHMDTSCREVQTTVPLFVWPKTAAVVAVDFDSLPMGGGSSKEVQAAAVAMKELSLRANILYLVREDVCRAGADTLDVGGQRPTRTGR